MTYFSLIRRAFKDKTNSECLLLYGLVSSKAFLLGNVIICYLIVISNHFCYQTLAMNEKIVSNCVAIQCSRLDSI